MSFILDAIAKSEQERQQQEVPSARNLALQVHGSQRSPLVWPYLLAGALLLNAILLTIWLQSDTSLFDRLSLPGGETVGRPADQAVEPGNMPEPTKGTRNEVVEIEDSDSMPSKEVAVATASADLPPRSSSSLRLDGLQVESNDRTLETATEPADEPGLLPPRQIAGTRDAGDTELVRMEPETTLDSKSSTESEIIPPSTDNADKESSREIYRLNELPADVRRDLPSVAFTGHLYSSNPASSYIFVDGGRQIIEGQQITNELFLHEITPTGVVLEFRGYLVDIGVLRNWSLN
ncbi:MAG: general secretion pathway protein GspB [Gammaproteobacteria bacterium]|nr:general secretion pathway protein GspB [Gammaproteobacteria bacterium]MDH3449463.1 general secretion pathway protein GspB [Gammaproteobacteria bacterium]